MTNQSANTNFFRMEFSAITIWSKYIAMIRVFLDKTRICANQVSTSIDRWGDGDCGNSFRSQNICNKMSIHFGWNINYGISENPPITIIIVSPQITVLKSGTGIGFGCNIIDDILPRNIGILILFNIGASDFFQQDHLVPWRNKK